MSGRMAYTCAWCGSSFMSRQKNRKHCSRSCSTSNSNSKRSPEVAAKIASTVKKQWADNRPKMMKSLAGRDYSKVRRNSRKLWKNKDFRRKICSARKQAGYTKSPLTPLISKMRIFCKNTLRRCLSGVSKTDVTQKLLGYTPNQLRQHIESLFKTGMAWENYGKWEIDHKRPISSFAIGTPPNVVNALTNLQPLWKTENRKKWKHYGI